MLRAGNGYIHKIIQADYRTTGQYNPALDTFEYTDFLPAKEQPSLDYLKSTTWNYYAFNYAEAKPVRRKIGQVTIEENAEQSSQDLPVLNVKGLSGVEFQEGGALLGMYMPGVSTFAGYNGALALFTDQNLTTGIYEGQTVTMGFVPLENTNVYFGYGMFMGAVAEGYLYCVPSPAALEQGLTFSFLFSGSPSALFSLMGEMMLVDPAKDLGGLSSAALERIAILRKQAVEAFTPRNFVELPRFSGAAGRTPAVTARMPENLIVAPMPASAPSVKRSAARISVMPAVPAPVSAAGEFRNVGIRAEKAEK